MIQRENLDKVFELFEPLISNLIGKNKEGRAIGLLGLVLQAPQVHIPALEKLAFIYRLMDQKGNLELALRVLLKEFREKGLKEKRLNVLKELRELRPSDQEIEKEYSLLRKEYGVFDQLDIEDKVALLSSQDQEVISQNLKRVDECVREGKIRSARQILENLQILYPSERQIARRIALVDEIPPEVAVEEAPPFVEIPAARGRGPVIPENVETDEVVFKGKTKDFFDLNLPIAEEKMAMDAAFDEQVKDKAESVGKELKEIAAQFQKAPEEKDDKISSEARYNLGIALLEQEMYEDAIQELRLAAKDPDRAADCLGMVSHCYRRLAKPQEAVKWIRQAIQLSRQGSPQFFALKYDMASLYEEMKDWPKALSLYQEVLAWDSTYKNTSQKVEALKKSSRDSRS
jgi:tetratricopeptide (TPR) repeat protein